MPRKLIPNLCFCKTLSRELSWTKLQTMSDCYDNENFRHSASIRISQLLELKLSKPENILTPLLLFHQKFLVLSMLLILGKSEVKLTCVLYFVYSGSLKKLSKHPSSVSCLIEVTSLLKSFTCACNLSFSLFKCSTMSSAAASANR